MYPQFMLNILEYIKLAMSASVIFPGTILTKSVLPINITGCGNGTYGRGCLSTCGQCQNGTCNVTNGHCLYGCLSGWQSPHCIERKFLMHTLSKLQ